jgi:hypothetical protein
MAVVLYLLCLFGALGSLDIIYYHLFRFRLYQSASSRGEQITHLLRLILFPLMMGWVLWVQASGWLSVGLFLLVAFDLLNGLLDAYLEPQSRKPMGGLPRGEYLLHMVLMGVAGAVLLAAAGQCSGVWNQPAEWKWQLLDAPRWAKMLGFQLAAGSLLLFAIEGFGFSRSIFKKAN